MPEQQINEIAVNTRTIIIAGEIIAIAQVVRLRVIQYHDKPGFSPGRRLILNLALLVAFIGWVLNELTSRSSDVGIGMIFAGLFLALIITAYCTIGPHIWILVTELASGSVSTLSSPQPQPLHHLKDDIYRIIEDPPKELTTFTVHNIYKVDLKNASGVQIGNSNTQSNS